MDILRTWDMPLYSPLNHQAENGILAGEDTDTVFPKGEMREASKQRGIGGCFYANLIKKWRFFNSK